jgi:hypothetical protein
MKRILSALVALVLLATPVLAQTTVDNYWFGSGNLQTYFTAGDDAHSYLDTAGAGIAGEFHGVDNDDNPHGYNVDTVTSSVDASVFAGYIQFENWRDDSKTSMYGNPGQHSYSYVGSSGTGEMAWYSWTNYAEMANCEYKKPTTTSGKNFEASGSSFIIDHWLTDASGDGANVLATGSGSAQIKLMGEKAGGKDTYFNMGFLPVCGDGCAWDNNYATFDASGTGTLSLSGWADNSLTVGACPSGSCVGVTIPGDGSDNSATYNLVIGYSGVFNYPDFGIKGN